MRAFIHACQPVVVVADADIEPEEVSKPWDPYEEFMLSNHNVNVYLMMSR